MVAVDDEGNAVLLCHDLKVLHLLLQPVHALTGGFGGKDHLVDVVLPMLQNKPKYFLLMPRWFIRASACAVTCMASSLLLKKIWSILKIISIYDNIIRQISGGRPEMQVASPGHKVCERVL